MTRAKQWVARDGSCGCSHGRATLVLGFLVCFAGFFFNLKQSLRLVDLQPQPTPCDGSGTADGNLPVVNDDVGSAQDAMAGSAVPWQRRVDQKTTVVVFACDSRYCDAVASSVVSVRLDGRYRGDIAVITRDVASQHIIARIQSEWKQHPRAAEQPDDGSDLLQRLYFFRQEDMLPDGDYRRNAPPEVSCVPPKRKLGRQGYYIKAFIFHPAIVKRWDLVMFMDACMTIHAPRLRQIFRMPEVEHHILALPDPWKWGQHMLEGRLLSCANETLVEELSTLIQTNLRQATYFTTAFLVFDTSAVVRRQQGSIATADDSAFFLELLDLYHKFGVIFPGDQIILSIYWFHLRDVMRSLPLSMIGSNHVPYEWLPRVKGPHIVTAGNEEREQCKARPKNDFGQHKQRKLNDDDESEPHTD